MEASLHFEAGAFKGSPMGPGCMTIFTPYDVPNMYVEGFDVVLNKPKVAAYRAPGAPQAEFAAEMAMNELANKLDMDPIELRLKNAAKEGTQTIYGPKRSRWVSSNAWRQPSNRLTINQPSATGVGGASLRAFGSILAGSPA